MNSKFNISRTVRLRRICAALLAAASALTFAACSGGGNNTPSVTTGSQNATSGSETEKLYLDNLPDTLNYDSATIRFLSAVESTSIEIGENDDTGDLVNEAYWKRNNALEARLGVKLDLIEQTGSGEFNGIASLSVNSGGDDYDIFCGHTRFNIALASQGAMLDLSNVANIDIAQPYWSELYIKNITYKDNLYWLTGDLTHNFIAYLYGMFVNADMWHNNFPDQDIYEIVKSGGWTLDKLNEFASVAYSDLNGNTEQDDDDAYGVIMQKGHVLNGMFFAAGTQYTDTDADGTPKVVLDNEHTVNVFTKLHDLFYSTQYGHMLENSAFDTMSIKMFSENRLLFCPGVFEFVAKPEIRGMEKDFYVIPLPKYDENQQNYRVNQYDGVPIYGMPTTVKQENVDMLGAVLEAMCSMTSDMVIPVYYDVALKNKYSRDETTAEMIDLIHNSITADFSFQWGDSVGGIMNIFYDNIQNENIASTLTKRQKSWDKDMAKLIERLDKAGA